MSQTTDFNRIWHNHNALRAIAEHLGITLHPHDGYAVPSLSTTPPTPAVTVEDVKMLRETLCEAQVAITNRMSGQTAWPHLDRLQRLIDQLDVHRPLGPDGTHGDLHTPTCGCVDLAPTQATPARTLTIDLASGDWITPGVAITGEEGARVASSVLPGTSPEQVDGWYGAFMATDTGPIVWVNEDGFLGAEVGDLDAMAHAIMDDPDAVADYDDVPRSSEGAVRAWLDTVKVTAYDVDRTVFTEEGKGAFSVVDDIGTPAAPGTVRVLGVNL